MNSRSGFRILKNLTLGGALRFSLLVLLASCSGTGYQGGRIPTNFKGIKTIQAVSPDEIEITWEPFPGAVDYKIYTPTSNNAIATIPGGISKYQFNPTSLGIAKTDLGYTFSVTVTNPLTRSEEGSRSAYASVTLLPRFSFKQSSSTLSPIQFQPSLRLNWQAFPAVLYKIYYSERSAKGDMVNYPDNRLPATPNGGTVTGLGEVTLSGLLQGREYCVFITANYPDNTMDAPDGTKWAGPLDNLIKGPTNTFAGSIVAKSQKCQRTYANEDFGQVVTESRAYSLKAHPNNEPTFLVIAKNDTALSAEDDGDNSIPANTISAKTTIYRVDENTGTGIEVGTSIGSGKIKPINPISSGRYKFFALLEEVNPNLGSRPPAQARKDLVVGVSEDKESDSWVHIRGFQESTSDPAMYPEHQQGGAGSLRMGQSVAMGDFNCDGKSDLAVGLPDVIEVPPGSIPPRPAKLGRVMIYYDVSAPPDSRTNSSRVQTIRFDTSQISSTARDLQLGVKLQVGNFNGDNQARSLPPAEGSAGLQEKFSCDDLVIGSGAGLVFVLYGKRDNASGPGVPGGLVYAGPNSFTPNPAPPCSATNQDCGGPSLYRYELMNGNYLKLGSAFTVGDFDGDGYQDLAMSSTGGSGIWVLRGGQSGLTLPNRYDGDLSSSSNSEAVELEKFDCPRCFPYIKGKPQVPAAGASPTPDPLYPATADGWANGGEFGFSLGVFRNGYYDSKTKRIRDVLLVGNPSYSLSEGRQGRVFGCIPKTKSDSSASFTSDSALDLEWDCNHFIDPPLQYQTQSSLPISSFSGSSLGVVRGFGWALAGFENALRYSPQDIQEGSGCKLINGNSTIPAPTDFGNCPDTATGLNPAGFNLGFPGGVAISAMRSNSVFFYFGVTSPSIPQSQSRDDFGAKRNEDLLARIFATPANVTTVSPSPVTNAVAIEQSPCTVSGATESCRIQLIRQNSPSGSFGYNIAAIRGSNIYDPDDKPKTAQLAVSAPYRSLTQGSVSYPDVGQVLLIAQDTVSSTSPITVGTIRRFAKGFLSSGVTLDYDRANSPDPNTVVSGARFGMGGIAGGALEAGTEKAYNDFTDIVVGVPGHKRAVISNGVQRLVSDNGSAMVFFSNGTSFLNRRVSDSSGPSLWHSIDQVFEANGTLVGQESDLKFHQAVSIGDVDLDGVDDLAARISSGSSKNLSRIFYGATCSSPDSSNCNQKFKTNQSGTIKFTDFKVAGDDSAGIRFVPVGAVGSTTRQAFFITGERASYLYFTDINSGIAFGDPSVNGSPRKFIRPTAPSSNYSYLDFSDQTYFNADGTSLGNALKSMNSFATGDFNGDGKMDYAFGQDSSATITDTRTAGTCPIVNGSRVCFAGNSVGSGRVFVWYGGASNGPAVQPDGSSGYPLVTEYSGLGGNDKFGFATLSNVTDQTSGSPCGDSGGITCNRIQTIAESGVSGFGQTITSIPVGKCGLNPVSALAVRGINSSGLSSSIFLYLPKCLESGTPLSGLVAKGLKVSSDVSPIVTSLSFGESLLGVGGDGIKRVMKSTSLTTSANGELVGHLIATDSREGMVYSLPLVRNASGSIQFEPLPSSALYDKTASFFKLGGRINNYKEQFFLSPLSPSDGRFGFSSSFLGDLNADGYGDIGINIASVHRKENSSTYLYQGGVLVLFGGASGLQTHRESTSLLVSPRRDSESPCYLVKKSSLVSVCDPQLLFSPQPSLSKSPGQGAYEFMYLSPFSHLSTGTNPITGACSVTNSRNECLGSFIFGVPGRDSPPSTNNLSRILQGGAFYVQP